MSSGWRPPSFRQRQTEHEQTRRQRSSVTNVGTHTTHPGTTGNHQNGDTQQWDPPAGEAEDEAMHSRWRPPSFRQRQIEHEHARRQQGPTAHVGAGTTYPNAPNARQAWNPPTQGSTTVAGAGTTHPSAPNDRQEWDPPAWDPTAHEAGMDVEEQQLPSEPALNRAEEDTLRRAQPPTHHAHHRPQRGKQHDTHAQTLFDSRSIRPHTWRPHRQPGQAHQDWGSMGTPFWRPHWYASGTPISDHIWNLLRDHRIAPWHEAMQLWHTLAQRITASETLLRDNARPSQRHITVEAHKMCDIEAAGDQIRFQVINLLKIQVDGRSSNGAYALANITGVDPAVQAEVANQIATAQAMHDVLDHIERDDPECVIFACRGATHRSVACCFIMAYLFPHTIIRLTTPRTQRAAKLWGMELV